MIEVRLFGTLRRFAENPSVNAESVARTVVRGGDTVGDVLFRLGIEPAREVGQVFINGRYVHAALATPVGDGDRLGVFPKNMAMLYC